MFLSFANICNFLFIYATSKNVKCSLSKLAVVWKKMFLHMWVTTNSTNPKPVAGSCVKGLLNPCLFIYQ